MEGNYYIRVQYMKLENNNYLLFFKEKGMTVDNQRECRYKKKECIKSWNRDCPNVEVSISSSTGLGPWQSWCAWALSIEEISPEYLDDLISTYDKNA